MYLYNPEQFHEGKNHSNRQSVSQENFLLTLSVERQNSRLLYLFWRKCVFKYVLFSSILFIVLITFLPHKILIKCHIKHFTAEIDSLQPITLLLSDQLYRRIQKNGCLYIVHKYVPSHIFVSKIDEGVKLILTLPFQ